MRRLVCVGVGAVWMLAGAPVGADQVVPDDVIVNGSACVGPDCTDGMDFGFSTVVLQGPELRLRFLDTSSSASFPTRDWQITVNDDDAGSAERFSIEDVDAGTTPFTIEADAPRDSIHVGASGSVGIGTASPDPTAALDVVGDVRVRGSLMTGGSVLVTTPAKAGIVPAAAFVDGQARVDFTTPYAGDYTVALTAMSDRAGRTFRPTVIARDASGFTIAVSRRRVPRGLLEVHWITNPVGE